VSSEEGYYSTDSDENKLNTPHTTIPPNNTNKNFSTEQVAVKKNPLKDASSVVTSPDPTTKNTPHENNLPNSEINKIINDVCDVTRFNNKNSNNERRPRLNTNERLKRSKMEELKIVYKQYAASRGSQDLYKSLLDTYADFDFHPEIEDRIFPVGVKTDVSAKTKRRYSVCEKEALMRRDLVLTEMADTEKNYVDDLGFIVNVSNFAIGKHIWPS